MFGHPFAIRVLQRRDPRREESKCGSAGNTSEVVQGKIEGRESDGPQKQKLNQAQAVVPDSNAGVISTGLK